MKGFLTLSSVKGGDLYVAAAHIAAFKDVQRNIDGEIRDCTHIHMVNGDVFVVLEDGPTFRQALHAAQQEQA